MQEKRFCLQCDDGTLLEHGARDLSFTRHARTHTVPQVWGWHCPVCKDCHFDDKEGDRYGAAMDAFNAQMEDGCLAHADFFIGREFWTEIGRWRCTDVGTRTICAISLERHEVTTLHPDDAQTTDITYDPSWLDGPPYAVAEHVFDESCFGALYATGRHGPLQYSQPMAPTVVRDGQFRLFFFSREETRIHVHVAHPDGEAKFWLTPQVGLANHTGLSAKQCHEAQMIVQNHIEEIRNAWHHHFGS